MTSLTKKKVLFVITKSNWGGAQRYVYDLATHLDQTQFECVVALGGNGQLKELLTHAGITSITIEDLERDVSLKKEWRFFWQLVRLLRAERPDILHLNSSKAGGVGAIAGRMVGIKKIIFTAHGWAFNEDRPLWQRLLIKVLHYVTVILSHRTIAVSRSIVHQMQWPLASQRLKVVNPGRSIGVMYQKAEAREKLTDFCPALRAHTSDTWVGTIAELHPIKRLDVLIQSFAGIITTNPHTRLVLIGDGSERERLQSLIAVHALEKHVFLTGSIVEAARFLKAFDIFTLPSKSESYGYVLHEAGLAGVPVVASNVGGIPDIITTNVTGLLVAPNDAAALQVALTTYLTNKPLRLKHATALTESLKNRTVETMTDATVALYTL